MLSNDSEKFEQFCLVIISQTCIQVETVAIKQYHQNGGHLFTVAQNHTLVNKFAHVSDAKAFGWIKFKYMPAIRFIIF